MPDQADAIARFVEQGGGLVASLDAPLFDEFGDPRPNFALARVLGAVRSEEWSADDLRALPELDEADRGEELELAREWFGALAELYGRCAAGGRVVVVERIF